MTTYVSGSFAFGNWRDSLTAKSPFRSVEKVPCLPDSTSAENGSEFEVYFTFPNDPRGRIWNYGFVIDHDGVQEEWLNVKARTAREMRPPFIVMPQPESSICQEYRANITKG